jgi:hypothetical protein
MSFNTQSSEVEGTCPSETIKKKFVIKLKKTLEFGDNQLPNTRPELEGHCDTQSSEVEGTCPSETIKKKFVIKLKKTHEFGDTQLPKTRPELEDHFDTRIGAVLPNRTSNHFKDYIFHQILSRIDSQKLSEFGCTQWLGYKKNHRHYSESCHIVHLKNGAKQYINPQKYIYNYLNYPNASYGQLINMRNRVRNIDSCKNRGICCHLKHIEDY